MNRAQQAMTRRETVHGGSTPASMRLMVIANCDRFTSLAVNDLTGNVVKLLNDMLYTLNLVPFGTEYKVQTLVFPDKQLLLR
jgi:hypothetical protein